MKLHLRLYTHITTRINMCTYSYIAAIVHKHIFLAKEPHTYKHVHLHT